MAVLIKENLIYSDANKIIHRIGTDVYFNRAVALLSDTVNNFEEVDEIPSEEVAKAREEKITEIDSYDKSKDVEWFIVNGVGMWYDAPKRATIKNLVESSIKEERNTIILWTEEEPIIPIEVSCDLALDLLAKLEVYAGDCLANTQKHKAAVNALTSVEEIEAYDYKTGYPDKLNLSTK